MSRRHCAYEDPRCRTSAMRMRRIAFANDASTPIMSNSNASSLRCGSGTNLKRCKLEHAWGSALAPEKRGGEGRGGTEDQTGRCESVFCPRSLLPLPPLPTPAPLSPLFSAGALPIPLPVSSSSSSLVAHLSGVRHLDRPSIPRSLPLSVPSFSPLLSSSLSLFLSLFFSLFLSLFSSSQRLSSLLSPPLRPLLNRLCLPRSLPPFLSPLLSSLLFSPLSSSLLSSPLSFSLPSSFAPPRAATCLFKRRNGIRDGGRILENPALDPVVVEDHFATTPALFSH